MRHCKKAMIVDTIIGLVMAAVFMLIAADVLGDFFGQFPRVTGAIVDSSKVVCFGGGYDHHMHCLDKDSGEELFSVGSGTKWNLADAKSTPALTKTAIYFGLGQYFCGFTVAGPPKFECQKLAHTIPTGIAVDESKGLACFGDDGAHTFYCRSTSDGLAKFSVHGGWGDCPKGQLYKIKVGDNINFEGHQINLKAIDGANKITAWADKSYAQTIDGEGYLNFNLLGGKIKVVVVETERKPSEAAVLLIGDKPECRAESTPAIAGDYVYFGLGNRVCKYRTSFLGKGEPATDTSEEWCIKTDWTIPTGIAVDENKKLMCYGGGKDHNVWCRNTDTSGWEFKVHGNWKDCPNVNGCIAVSTPAITNDAVYFGLGNRVCKYKIDIQARGNPNHEAAAAIDESRYWCSKAFGHTIPTGIAVNEELGYACFGGGAAYTVYCLSTSDGTEIFKVRAGNWDATDAMSTPAIKNNTLYLGLGDHACAFELPIAGDTNKDFALKKYAPNVDPDILWQDATDRGCADVDWTIPTGIAVFDEGESRAAEQQGAGQQEETCTDDSIDLILSDIVIEDSNGAASFDKANFPAGQPFTVSIALQSTNNNCASFATIGLYGSGPGQAEQLLESWSAVQPGQTVKHTSGGLPNLRGDFTITFKILSTTPQVQPPNGDVARIVLTVQ